MMNTIQRRYMIGTDKTQNSSESPDPKEDKFRTNRLVAGSGLYDMLAAQKYKSYSLKDSGNGCIFILVSSLFFHLISIISISSLNPFDRPDFFSSLAK